MKRNDKENGRLNSSEVSEQFIVNIKGRASPHLSQSLFSEKENLATQMALGHIDVNDTHAYYLVWLVTVEALNFGAIYAGLSSYCSMHYCLKSIATR